MDIEVKIPGVGESITEGLLAKWLVAEGAFVREGQAVLELETDKTTIDVTASATGALHIKVPEGTDVVINQVVAVIDTEVLANSVEDKSVEDKTELEEKKTLEDSSPSKVESVQAPMSQSSQDMRITPAAKSVAAEKGINPASVQGTGRKGMVTKDDIRNLKSTPSNLSSESVSGEVRKPLSRLRKMVAKNLAKTRDELVLLTTFNEVDMSAVKALRAKYGERFRDHYGVKLGFMSIFLKASSAALRQFPEVNAWIDSEKDEVLYRDGIHISVAVSTPKGLLTPVIRNVQNKSFADIEKEIIGFGQKVADKTLMPEDLMGGTFTITNGGIFGSMMSTPLPAPGQSAILGMHAIQDRPVVRNGEILIRPMMYLALSYDHRLIDGREAVGCLKAIKDAVEEPELLLLEV